MDFFVNIGNNDFILYISLIAQKIQFFGKKKRNSKMKFLRKFK